MDKKDVLFEAAVDFVTTFVIALVAFLATHADPTSQIVLMLIVVFTGLSMFMDFVRRKGWVRVLTCGLTTFLGAIAGGALVYLLK